MKFLGLLSLCLLALADRLAASNIDDGTSCTIETATGDAPFRITLPLNDGITIFDNVDKQIFNEKSTGKITDLKCDTGDDYNGFFDVHIDSSNNITISPNIDKMKSFDKITPKADSNFKIVSINCNFNCYDIQKKMLVEIKVDDYNDHNPTFDKNTPYEFEVPIPLTTGFQTNFKSGIVVEDVDFSNQNVDFTIEPNDFEIISQPMKDDPKRYIPTFSAKELIQFSEKKTYTLTVTDQGTRPGKLQSTATLTLKIDASQSPDSPSFEAPSYNFDYKIQNNNPVLIPIKGNLILNTRKPQLVTAASIRIEGELKPYLTAKFDAGTKTISLESKAIPAGFKTLFSTLAVATDGVREALTAIVVHMPEITFSSNSYTVTYYADNNTVVADTEIKVTSLSGDTPTVTLGGNNAKYFNISKAGQDTYEIKPSKDMDKKVVAKNTYISLQILAELDGTKSSAALIVNVPSKSDKIAFTSSIYKATYSIDPLAVKVEDPIKFKAAVSNVNITINKDYDKYFKADYVADQVTLSTKSILEENVLQKESAVLLTLKAVELESAEETTCTVNVELPIETKAPIYGNTFYSVVYPKNATINSVVKFSPAISFSNVADQSKLVLGIQDFNDSISAMYTGTEWVLKIAKLMTKLPVRTNLIAKRHTGNTVESKIALNIDGENDAQLAPKFTKAYYEINYEVKGTDHTISTVYIELTNVKDPANVVINAEQYKDNFIFKLDGAQKWKITLNRALSDAILKDQKPLLDKLTVTEKGNSNVDTAILVVHLPITEDETPVFSSPLYQAKYSISGDKPSLAMLDGNVIKISKNGDGAVVSLSCTEMNNIMNYFTITPNKDHYVIEIKNPLPDETLQKTTLSITMTAEKGVNIGYAALVIYMPEKSQDKNIVFSNVLYHGKYDAKDDKLNLDQITVNTNEADNNVDCCDLDSTFKEWFSVSYKNKQVTISIKNPIPKDRLKDVANIVVKVTIGVKGSGGKSSAVLNIDVDNNMPEIDFSNVLYHGQYDAKDDKLNLDQITVNTNQADDNVECCDLDSTFKEWFSVSYKNKQMTISLKNPIPKERLKDVANIAVKVTIGVKGSGGKSSAVLNIDVYNIPKIDFSSVLYHGEYDAKDSKLKLDQLSVKTTEADDSIECCELDSKFKPWFNVSYKNKQVSLSIKDPIPKDKLEDVSNIAVKVTIGVKESTDKSSAVLNIDVEGIDSDSSDSSSDNDTIYIVIICILALLIVALISAAVVFYRRKIRNPAYTEVDEEKPQVKFEKGTKDSVTSSRKSSIINRRPTGYTFQPPPDEDNEHKELPSAPAEENEYTEPIGNPEYAFAENRNRKKSVVFDDNVEKLPIDSNDSNNEDDKSIASIEKQPDNLESDTKPDSINNTTVV